VVVQYLRLWDYLQNIHLSDEPDKFIWKWSYNEEFSSSSAYRALFLERTSLAGADRIWKVQAPDRCRFFGWLVLHGRCWTSNRLRQHGMRDSDTCAVCAQEVETLDHLLLGCVHSQETWFRVLSFYGLDHLTPQELPYFDWWLAVRKWVHKSQRKSFDSLALLVIWSLWKESNPRVRERVALQPVSLAPRILEEAQRWARAGFVGLAFLVIVDCFVTLVFVLCALCFLLSPLFCSVLILYQDYYPLLNEKRAMHVLKKHALIVPLDLVVLVLDNLE
jgi:hypothetical protein